VARLVPIVPIVPAGLNVWQAPQPLETKTAFPFQRLQQQPVSSSARSSVVAWSAPQPSSSDLSPKRSREPRM
jgi:hypothetical protein